MSDAYVVVRSILPGTFNQLTDIRSSVGHAWFEIHQSGNASESYGYYPTQKAPTADGKVDIKDRDSYRDSGFTSDRIAVDQAQIQKIREYAQTTDANGNWTILGGSQSERAWNCATWSIDVLRYADVHARLQNSSITPWFLPFYLQAGNLPSTWDVEGWNIDDIVNSLTSAGQRWTAPRDPLVLDLDGDGVELTSSASSVLFDHNADNIRTGSQWVMPVGHAR